MKMSIFASSILVAAFVSGPVSGETKVRVGHFPNITHAQGVIAHALSRQGKGWFEQRLGPDTKIEWPGDSFDCRCGERRIRTGCATGSELEGGGGFSRKENRDAAIGQHPGHFVPGVVERRRTENHPARRRRSSAADPKSGPTRIVSRKESRC